MPSTKIDYNMTTRAKIEISFNDVSLPTGQYIISMGESFQD